MSRKANLLRKKILQVTQVRTTIKPGTKSWDTRLQAMPRLEGAQQALPRVVRHDAFAPKANDLGVTRMERRLVSLYTPKGQKGGK
jgi:hypothetical protein